MKCDSDTLKLQTLALREYYDDEIQPLTYGPGKSWESGVGIFSGITIWLNMEGYTGANGVDYIGLGVWAFSGYGFLGISAAGICLNGLISTNSDSAFCEKGSVLGLSLGIGSALNLPPVCKLCF